MPLLSMRKRVDRPCGRGAASAALAVVEAEALEAAAVEAAVVKAAASAASTPCPIPLGLLMGCVDLRHCDRIDCELWISPQLLALFGSSLDFAGRGD